MQPNITKGSTLWLTNIDDKSAAANIVRQHHPSRNDVGLTGEVIRIEKHRDDDCCFEPGDLDYVMFTVMTHGNSPKVLELMDHEVTLITS